MKPDQALPLLRQELKLIEGPPSISGAPTWTLCDPVRNLFFRIGRLEFECLSRWAHNNADTIVASINRETTLSVDKDDLSRLLIFLKNNHLVRPDSPDAVSELKDRFLNPDKKPVIIRFFQHYLFFRVPLIRPDRFLSATLPMVEKVFKPYLFYPTALFGLIGCFLILRQWDIFVHSFQYYYSPQGIFLYGLIIVLVKACHELGHVYAMKHYGLKVPVMGAAFLVLWPVLYSDNSDAWKLKCRISRMKITAAGVLVEFFLAVIATFLWSFMPDGAMKHICFITATVTWTSSILINISPFLRFDGYYLLSDFLDIPNLHQRSFALGKWYLRKIILGINTPCPDVFSGKKRCFLIGFAYATWIYRLILFTGIALFVYHLFFKVLGLILFSAEMIYFIFLPVYREAALWRRFYLSPGFSRYRVLVCLFVSALFIYPVLYPFHSSIRIPAVLKSAELSYIYPPFSAQITSVWVKNNQMVNAGDRLFELRSLKIEYEEKRARIEVEKLKRELDRLIGRKDLLEQMKVIQHRLSGAMTKLEGLELRKKQLQITALQDGMVTDMAEGLKSGKWVHKDEMLAIVMDPHHRIIEGYAAEADLADIHVGDTGRFYQENGGPAPLFCVINKIDPAGLRSLSSPYPAFVFGGEIPVRKNENNESVVVGSYYRVFLSPEKQTAFPDQAARGAVVVKGKPRRLMMRMLNRIGSVFIRESGF